VRYSHAWQRLLDKKVAGALHVVEHENRRTGHHRIGISISLRPEIECEIGDDLEGPLANEPAWFSWFAPRRPFDACRCAAR
jgi:hypothetical protein